MAQIHAIEIMVNEFFQSLGGWMQTPMLAITALGYEEFFVLLLPTLYWCFDQMIGFRVGLMLLLGNTFNNFFKFLFHTPRPYWVSESVRSLSHETSFGLPSGHAQIAATVWGWLAVEVRKRWFRIAALVIILLIGLSRIYLGVHFLSDVLLGWILGGLLVWAFGAWYPAVGAWVNRKTLWGKIGLIILSTVLMLGLIFGVKWFAEPSWEMDPAWAERAGEIAPYSLDGALTVSGTWFGMLIGFVVLMEKRGKFLAGQGGWKRLVRFVVGLIGIFALYFGLGQIFPRNADLISYLLRFVRYTLIGLWVSWLGPQAFEQLGLLDFVDKKGS
jgi:membrane-associated phospholipid phosphatase